ncbi:MAG: ParB/RepB/Spo0J family partition protein [Lachnospiraceae bacterium]|nr:ParB/RepB/Spo0J family partition protein [Lachnospiraceae bacterium]MBO6299064.1 ParB/RepB/Spo0J family partition protein [Lachnospiraceae bacterium]
MTMKKGLGRGLDAMIPNKIANKVPDKALAPKTENVPEAAAAATAEPAADGTRMVVDILKVDRNKKQPRKKFDENALEELADSIRQVGILQPILVTKKGDIYEIVAGERRWRAARQAGLKEVPVIVREFTEEEIDAISLIENLQRQDLNAIEEAQAFKRLKEAHGMTDDQIAEKVSKSRAAITNSMRLLKLDNRVQEMVIDEKISMGLARALLGVDDSEKQYEMAQDAFDRRMSVRDVEKLVKQLNAPKKAEKKKQDLTQYQLQFDEYAQKMADALGVKVAVTLKDKNTGRLEIDFYNTDDFERLYDRLK